MGVLLWKKVRVKNKIKKTSFYGKRIEFFEKELYSMLWKLVVCTIVVI